MVTEILIMVELTRKLWSKGTRKHRALAVALWLAFGAALPFVLRLLERLPEPVLITLPVVAVTVATVRVTTMVRSRRIRNARRRRIIQGALIA